MDMEKSQILWYTIAIFLVWKIKAEMILCVLSNTLTALIFNVLKI